MIAPAVAGGTPLAAIATPAPSDGGGIPMTQAEAGGAPMTPADAGGGPMTAAVIATTPPPPDAGGGPMAP